MACAPSRFQERVQDKRAGIAITIIDEALPRRLRAAMAARLQQAWRDAAAGDGAAGGFGLTALLDAASRDFVALVTSIPELVEAYEGADAAGATVRRYAIVNEDQQVEN